eukprot:9406492-Ditylum_brightwellii.AAC.1
MDKIAKGRNALYQHRNKTQAQMCDSKTKNKQPIHHGPVLRQSRSSVQRLGNIKLHKVLLRSNVTYRNNNKQWEQNLTRMI